MPAYVIQTGARLHFGLLAVDPPVGRSFGGAGVMIDNPGFDVRFEAAPEAFADEIVAPADWSGRIQEFVHRYRAHSPAGFPLNKVRIELRRSAPSHTGLGSGTQLGLAVAAGLALLSGEARQVTVDPLALAARVGRGSRSAIGLNGFFQGGLLVEGGKRTLDQISPLICRQPFPAEWRFLLSRPKSGAGLSGESECQGFTRLGPMPTATTERLCRVLLMELLPALREQDFIAFSAALEDFGQTEGSYFAPVQGDVIAAPRMRELAAWLRTRHLHGTAQSSWGPMIFTVLPNPKSAEQLCHELQADGAWADCEFQIAAPLNQPAQLRFEP